MLSPANKPLVNYIIDYNLSDGHSVMHFDAKVLYLIQGVPYQYECPVAIVTIQAKKLDAIYLLDSQIKDDGFEDMFIIKNEKIRYEKHKYLLIERNTDLKVYIFHVKSIASHERIMEKINSLNK